VFQIADSEGIPPELAAERLAERRMTEGGRLRTITLPGR
jgi:valine dehydrogenase (NAD+)